MTNLLFQCSKIVVIVLVVIILLVRLIATIRGGGSDLLAYTVRNYDEPESLMLYDFRNAVNIPIFRSNEHIGFSLSADGWLAYSSRKNDNLEIYLLNTQSIDQIHINITQSSTTFEYPLEWSPDGRYLAYISSYDENPLLYIWDGEKGVNITPEAMPDIAQTYHLAWSHDGRLAFTVWFGYPPEDSPNEIYLWDGNATINLSQNPNGYDHAPYWNADGQIMFSSSVMNESYISVWDGVSVTDGSPKLDRLFSYPTELSYAGLGWTPDGKLTGLTQTAQDTHLQIYVWDGQALTNISQNPTLHHGTPQWSRDGRIAFMTYYSKDLLFVRDANNNPLLTVKAQYSPAWSPNGLLMFCTPRKELAIWDGNVIVKIASGEIRASWGSGKSAICTSG